jgi:TfoX/Sxy family transcriptional regulator of competence genes
VDDTVLAQRIETYLEGKGEITERRVLSGQGLFLDGHLVAAVMNEDLCVQVGLESWETTLTGVGIRPLLFAERPVPGWVMIEGTSVGTDDALARWIDSVLAGR